MSLEDRKRRDNGALKIFMDLDSTQKIHVLGSIDAQKNYLKKKIFLELLQAFKNAWERACSSKYEAILVVPRKNYLVRPIRFNGPCKSNLTVLVS